MFTVAMTILLQVSLISDTLYLRYMSVKGIFAIRCAFRVIFGYLVWLKAGTHFGDFTSVSIVTLSEGQR